MIVAVQRRRACTRTVEAHKEQEESEVYRGHGFYVALVCWWRIVASRSHILDDVSRLKPALQLLD
eukprot:SAG31_NODE_102_length_25175_cov_10.778553_12_plen_65_part_00